MSNSDDIRDMKILGMIAGLLFLLGNKATNIVFRKNIGMGSDGLLGLITLVLLFLGLGITFFYIDSVPFEFLKDSKPNSFPITGIVFIILALYIAFKGFHHYRVAERNNIHPDYEGESNLLSFLNTNYEWSERTIKYFVEPFYILFVGTLYFFFNSLGGIIIIFLAISVWFNPIILLFGFRKEYNRINSNKVINKVSSK